MTLHKDLNQVHLLQLLKRWSSISLNFKSELLQHLEVQLVKPKEALFNPTNRLSWIWFSIDCWIAYYQVLNKDHLEVSQLHGPNEVFTDLPSFIKGQHTAGTAVVLQGTQLLRLSRTKFLALRHYPEIYDLLQEFLILQQFKYHLRLSILGLSDQNKVEEFASNFPIQELPGHVCASFLRMTQSRYSQAKSRYLRSI